MQRRLYGDAEPFLLTLFNYHVHDYHCICTVNVDSIGLPDIYKGKGQKTFWTYVVLALHNNISGHQYDIVGDNPILIDNKYLYGIHRTELVLNLADTTEHTVQKRNRV